MKTTAAGFADVIEVAEALQLRGPALEAMVAMFGFALPSSSHAVPLRPPSEPPPGDTADHAGDVGVITAATEALSPSVRRLEPVRQAPAPASAWTDPLSVPRRAPGTADLQRIQEATCRIEGFTQNRTGFLVSGNRIVTTAFLPVPPHGSTGQVEVGFAGRRLWARLGRRATLDDAAAVAFPLREPLDGIRPLTLGRATTGRWEGFGYLPDAVDAVSFGGRILDLRGRDDRGRPALVLASDNGPLDGDGLEGMAIVQGGRVVGILLDGRAAAGTALAARAEEIVQTALPDETVHEANEVVATQTLPFEGLFVPRDAVAFLRLAASMPTPGEHIDVARVTDDLARAKPLLTLPRLRVPSLAFGALLLVDVGQPMQPFWEDQQEFVDRFRRALRGLADVRFVGDDPQAGAGRERRKGSWTSFQLPRPGTPVIALSDLGCGFPPRPETARAWLALAGRLRRRQCRMVAFAPVRPSRVVPALRRAIAVAVWDRAARRRNLSRLMRLADG